MVMSIQRCIDDYISKNKNSTKFTFEIKEEIKKLLKEKCGYKFDIRTIRGKEIFEEILVGVGKKQNG